MGELRPVIRVEGLHKSFNKRPAVKDVSFDVFEGEIFCLLGPNGAGKSTTINILSTALPADRGAVYFHGAPVQKSPRTYKSRLGIVPQDLAIYEEISAAANVEFFASLYGLRGRELRDSVQRALAFVGLEERQRDKPSTFSGGMKRRLNIACAIAHEPEIIIMDEPTVGIDPQSRTHILDSIKALRDDGATIIYTTHYMEEVEAISTRIVIIDHGEIIAEGTKEQLKQSIHNGRFYTIETEDPESFDIEDSAPSLRHGLEDPGRNPEAFANETVLAEEAASVKEATLAKEAASAKEAALAKALYEIDGIKRVEFAKRGVDIATVQGIANLDKIIGVLVQHGVKIRNLTTSTVSLETVFLHLTGRSLRN